MQWLFGYGSLIWRPSFAYSAQAPAMIRGWARRFWQGSTDHRGVPGAPGRVVTLVPERGAVTWGRVYRIDPAAAEPILAALDHRERAGYQRIDVEVEVSGGDRVSAVAYRATESNRNFVGPASLEAIAEVVRVAEGPSGRNRDYVTELAAALRDMGADDPHVFALADLIR